MELLILSSLSLSSPSCFPLLSVLCDLSALSSNLLVFFFTGSNLLG